MKATPAHHSTFSACRRARADLFVPLWHLDPQYQESKGSGTNELHKRLGGHRGLFYSDPTRNEDHYICLRYGFGEEGNKWHIFEQFLLDYA